ncbi:hypothetical protein GCM10027200_85100 [Lentzea nigeriaca]
MVFSHRTALVTGASHGAAPAAGAEAMTNGRTTPAPSAKDNIVRERRLSTVRTLVVVLHGSPDVLAFPLMLRSTKRGDPRLTPGAGHYPNVIR